MAYLTREFRYAIGRKSIEVAGGGIDSGESPAEAARREVREELGVEASEWTDLGRIDPSRRSSTARPTCTWHED